MLEWEANRHFIWSVKGYAMTFLFFAGVILYDTLYDL